MNQFAPLLQTLHYAAIANATNGEAPAGLGYRYRRLNLRGMLQVYVAGPRVPGDKARVT